MGRTGKRAAPSALALFRTAASVAAAEDDQDRDDRQSQEDVPNISAYATLDHAANAAHGVRRDNRRSNPPPQLHHVWSSMHTWEARKAQEAYERKNAKPLDTSKFDGLVRSNALEAFALLGTVHRDQTMSLPVESIDALYTHLRIEHTRDAALFRLVPRVRAKRALDVIQNIIYQSALRSKSSVTDEAFRRLSYVLVLCAWFDQGERLKQLLSGAIKRQTRSGQPALQEIDALVDQLVEGEQWELIIDLFSHRLYPAEQPAFPDSYLTKHIITALMAARVGIREPFAVSAHFAQFASTKLQPTGVAYNLLVRAHIATGNYTAANEAMDEAKASGSTGENEQLLAALQGYRSLGLDVALERRILDNLAQLDASTARSMLHELIRMRISAYQRTEAKALLDYFDLELGTEEGASNGKIPADDETIILAFHLISLRPIPQDVKDWWTMLRSTSLCQGDHVIAILVRAMGRIGLAKEAFSMVAAAIRRIDPGSIEWSLPPSAQVGIQTCNALLKLATRRTGSRDVFAVSTLMRKANITADADSVLIVLDYARKLPNSSPTNLAKLLKRMLETAQHAQPTVAHLDALMASAVTASFRQMAFADLQSHPTDSEHGGDVTGGLIPTGPFADSIFWVIDILRTRGASGSAWTYANRLHYDAGQGRSVRGVPAARVVWNQLVERGFRPTTRHLLSLIKGYAQAGALNEARAVLKLARDTANPVTRGMLMVLMEAYGRRGAFSRARKVFEEIRALGKDDPSQGLDRVAVTSMIRLMIDGRKGKNAVYLVREELEPLGSPAATGMSSTNWNLDPFDEPAMLAGTEAYLLAGKYEAALRFVQRHSPGQLVSNALRRVVRDIRTALCYRIALQQNSSARLLPETLRSVLDEEAAAVSSANTLTDARRISEDPLPIAPGRSASNNAAANETSSEQGTSTGPTISTPTRNSTTLTALTALTALTSSAVDESAPQVDPKPQEPYISTRLRTLMSQLALANYLLAQDDIARPATVRANLSRKERNGLGSKLQRNRLAAIVKPRSGRRAPVKARNLSALHSVPDVPDVPDVPNVPSVPSAFNDAHGLDILGDLDETNASDSAETSKAGTLAKEDAGNDKGGRRARAAKLPHTQRWTAAVPAAVPVSASASGHTEPASVQGSLGSARERRRRQGRAGLQEAYSAWTDNSIKTIAKYMEIGGSESAGQGTGAGAGAAAGGRLLGRKVGTNDGGRASRRLQR